MKISYLDFYLRNLQETLVLKINGMLASSQEIRYFESQNLILIYFNQKDILLKITSLKRIGDRRDTV